jgi:amino acid transporter
LNAQTSQLRRELGLGDLVFFNIAAVVGIRWLAAAAHAGPGSITLWLLAAALFFIPSALAVATLSRAFPEQGGLYIWTKRNFGDWHGFLAGWCYWVSNVAYFPNLLIAGVGMATYMAGSRYAHLAQDRTFILIASVTLLWVALLAHLFGMSVAKWVENVGGLATYAAGAAIIVLGFVAWSAHGPATTMHVIPEWSWERVNFWSQIAFAFGGLELAAVMSGEIKNPQRNIPRAAVLSGAGITTFYIFGTLGILALLKPEQVDVVTGLAQTGAAAGERFHLPWLAPALAVTITIGVVGQLGAWVGGSARIPAVIGFDRYLPPWLAALHPRWGTPYRALLAQGVACTLLLFVMQLGENLRTGYQLLVDMTVITYFIPFLYIFAAAWKAGRKWSAAAGLFTTSAGIFVSAIPPAGASSIWAFELKLLGGCAVLIGVGRLAFLQGLRYQGR